MTQTDVVQRISPESRLVMMIWMNLSGDLKSCLRLMLSREELVSDINTRMPCMMSRCRGRELDAAEFLGKMIRITEKFPLVYVVTRI